MNDFDDTLVVEFSHKDSNYTIPIKYGDIIRGSRFGINRPDKVVIKHVGKDFVKDEGFKEFCWDCLYSLGKDANVEESIKELDKIDKYMFVNKMRPNE